MAGLVYVLGLLLAAAGAGAIALGYPYIRMEWGWAEIVGGATLVSGGVVTVAIGAVVQRLGALRRALDPASATVESEPEIDPSAEELDAAPPPAPDLAAASRRDAQAALAEPDIPKIQETPPPEDERPDQPPPDEPRRRREPLLTRLRSGLGRKRGGHDTPPEEGRPDVAAPIATDLAPSLERGSDLAAELSPRFGRPGPAAPDGRDGPADLDASPAAQPRTIVGRYQAGTASYALFTDGTIEVETETGVHSFGSMEELKDFIARNGA